MTTIVRPARRQSVEDAQHVEGGGAVERAGRLVLLSPAETADQAGSIRKST